MHLTFEEQAKQAADTRFVTRVQQCAASCALAVALEPEETPGHKSRAGFAQSILLDDGTNARRIARAVATLLDSEDPTDADLSKAVAAVWDAFAGVSA